MRSVARPMSGSRSLRTKVLNYSQLLVAVAVTLAVGSREIYPAKVAGVGLALITFLPVFLLMRKAVGLGDVKLVMWTVAGGFLFKLLALLIGVWVAVKVMHWNTLDFTVACLSFVLVLQIMEAGYFWSNQE